MRVKHAKFGLGVVLEEFISGGGGRVARVVFDNCPDEEKTILLSVLSESSAAIPEAAKKPKTRKPRSKKEKPETVSDSLLCPHLDEAARLAPDFDSGFESYTENT